VNLVKSCQRKGVTQVGAAYLRERFRWEAHLDIEYDGLKFNNGWTPLLSRLIAIEHPDLASMFTFKETN
jgi:hypothetical protein